MRDIMNFIKKNKNRIVVGVIILLTLIVSMIIFYSFDNDGMNNSGIYNVKYKVNQNGWTKYSRNGMTAGDKKTPIQNLEIKAKDKDGSIYYEIYTSKWSEQNYNATKNNSNQIYGIRINTSNKLYKKYDVCYRTYNNKDKWLNWTCKGNISGNKEEPITAIEIKIIPKDVVKFDYLRDFNKVLESEKNF